MLHLYGFFIGVAIVVGYSVAEKIDQRVKVVAPWVLAIGLIGARVWHVADMWEYYSLNLPQVVAVWQGGLSIWGGLLGGGVGLLIYHYIIKPLDNLREMLSAIVTGIPLAQAIGRMGNGANSEFTSRVWLLPWWGMEALLDLGLFCLVWRTRLARRIWVYILGYGMIRLVLQPYRL